MLAANVVTTDADVVNPIDNLTSLREAIAASNANPDASSITFGNGSGIVGGTDFTDATPDNLLATIDGQVGSAPIETDQRGVTRILFGAIDIGSFESTEFDQPVGTAGDDAFVLSYSGSAPAGTATLTISTNGGPITTVGTYPMSVQLTLSGDQGTDSLRIVGTNGNDTTNVQNSGVSVNGANLVLSSIENLVLGAGSGDDIYQFDADAPLGTVTLEESGDGSDSIDFSNTSVDVSLSLAAGEIQVVNPNLSLTLSSPSSFENLIGGIGDDRLTGNEQVNVLSGNAGNDRLNGGTNSDTLVGGLGNESYLFSEAATEETDSIVEPFDEGDGDLISFAGLTIPVTLDLFKASVQSVHRGRSIQLSSEFGIERAAGGDANDVLIGNQAFNTLIGNNGNDRLDGWIGDDELVGGNGNDAHVFGEDSLNDVDYVTESPTGGIDTLDFGEIGENVSLNLSLSRIQHVQRGRMLKLSSGEVIENAIGGFGSDTLVDNSLNNRLLGRSGDDRLTGNAGNDTLIGGQDDDTYLFGAATAAEIDSISESTNGGIDTISFAALTTPVSLDLGSQVAQNVHSLRRLWLSSGNVIENAVGGSANDVLTGNQLDNTLTGNRGNDTLLGAAGDDTLLGGNGDDAYLFGLAGATEADAISEAEIGGMDTLDFSLLSMPVTLNLAFQNVQPVHANRTLKLNSAVTIENAVGGSGNDSLLGNSLPNILVGNAGNDSLFGNGGNDILIGGLGQDILAGGSDDDIAIGGFTNYDSDVSSLNTLMIAWKATGVSYQQRIANLRNGVGAPAVSLVAGTTVKNDSSPGDTLRGHQENDWFFGAIDDLLPDLLAQEVLDRL